MEFYKEIFLEKAGSLAKKITEKEKQNVTHLKISGNINQKDFDVLDDMCTVWGTYDDYDNLIMEDNEPPFLKILDLGDSTMVDDTVLGEFTYYSKLEEVILPKNLTIISSQHIFEESFFLRKVVLPDSLKEIGFGAFINCESLDEINFPEGLKEISGLAFSGCSSLKSVEIPANVCEIGGAAFGYCNSIEEFKVDTKNKHFEVIDGVLFSKDKTQLISFPCGHKNRSYTIPDGVKIIADGAFVGSKIEQISFPNSLNIIERWAFQNCVHLKELCIPNSVEEIGEIAFRFCANIEKVRLSNNLKTLSSQIFCSCDKLKELEVPSSVEKIQEAALGWTHNLENLILNEGLKEINDDLKFTKIKKLYIPKTVEKIQSGLAMMGRGFHKIEYEVSDENPHFCSVEGSLYSKDKTRLILIFPTQKDEFVVPKGVQIIEDFVFENLDFEKIILPDTITTIRYRCFENCSRLREIHLPKSLKQLDFRAFDDCQNLEIIKLLAEVPPELTSPSANCWKFMGDAKKLTLFVPEASVGIYKKTKRWKDIKHIKAIK